jgi:hypothetical protein
MKWREALTAPLDATPLRTGGSLTVMQRLVGAVYGLHLVEASSTIYIVLPLGVARVDKVRSNPGVDLVVAFAGDDLVVAPATPEVVVAAASPEVVAIAAALEVVIAAAALQAILPVATREAVWPAETREAVLAVGPYERIVASGAGHDLSYGCVSGEERSDHNYHHRQQDAQPIH